MISALAPTPFCVGDGRRCADGGMGNILGIGGVFFRAKDPAALKAWYVDVLGVAIADYVWRQETVPTAFEPFTQDTDYFGSPIGSG